MNNLLGRSLPEPLKDLDDLSLDLRGSASQTLDRIWATVDADGWERTRNPWAILRNVHQDRLDQLANDGVFLDQLNTWLERRRAYLDDVGWFGREKCGSALKRVAYFSMEFALSEALPVYSGGLGVLAGDHLKSASDLGVPAVGIGLLYQQGYFRQVLEADGSQQEAFPYNDPSSLPVSPAQGSDGRWPRVRMALPGRTLFLRIWQAQVGKVTLYLLDTNDPMNAPWDRGITANLYAPGRAKRLLQELVLGIGGWLTLEKLGIEVEVCHLNEGHAAFAVLARAQAFARETGASFEEALWVTRAGNVFTTHTPVAAAFDQYRPELIGPGMQPFADAAGISTDQLLSLGRKDPGNASEPFNMAFLAMRGCAYANGVSQLHGAVSRGLFAHLFPGRPVAEIPIRHVTNGVHVPTWDSAETDTLWRGLLGEDWTTQLDNASSCLAQLDDLDLWEFRARARYRLVEYVRRRRALQLSRSGASQEEIHAAAHALDPNALTLGFARRFTEYKRPNLLLQDRERFARILSSQRRPVQLIVAGKAHPDDTQGKALVQEMGRFVHDFGLSNWVIFLEDYEMALAQQLVGGVDLWINTPRRPAEACGTSGMKVLVNGGLNLSVLDGWWAEAYDPRFGWQIGGGVEHDGSGDRGEAEDIYRLLEGEIVAEFYDRDIQGVPRSWISRVRASMSELTNQFSGDRMLRDYVEQAYTPAAERYLKRAAGNGRLGADLVRWRKSLDELWDSLHFSDIHATEEHGNWRFEAQVYLDELDCESVRVELFAEDSNGEGPLVAEMAAAGPIPGLTNVYRYTATVKADRPSGHFTPRIVSYHPEAVLPNEDHRVIWSG